MSATRQRIVTATSELFRHRGFHATSLKDITIAADAPTGSLYHFFPGGKTELARAVIVETGAAYQQLFELIADASPDMAAGVGDFFDGAAQVLEQSDYVDVCPIGTVAREVANTNETLRLATADVFERWTAAAASRFEHAGLDPDLAHELAVTVIAALEGAFVLARAHRDATILRHVGRQTVALVQARLPRKRSLSRSV
jgi:AcrR family transcriptional regulator